MNALQLNNLKRELARKSHGEAFGYVALVKGNFAVMIPTYDKVRYEHYLNEGYDLVFSALDGNVKEIL